MCMHQINQNLDNNKVDYLYLNGIKGIAAIAIVIFHYTDFIYFGALHDELVWRDIIGFLYDYGYYAVDIFFIISGMLFRLNYCEKIASFEYSFSGFMKRRIVKIAPLYILTTMITALLQWCLMAIREGYAFRHNATYNMVLASLLGIGKIGRIGGVVNGPAWYIEVLFLCYVVYFFGIFWLEISHIFVDKIIVSQKSLESDRTEDFKRSVCGGYRAYCYWAFLCLIIGMVLWNHKSELAFFDIDCGRGMVGFSVGFIIMEILSKKRDFSRIVSLLWCAVSAGLILIAERFAKIDVDIYGHQEIFFTLVVFPGVILFIHSYKIIRTILSKGIMNYLGKISFSMYLWHFPIEVCFILLSCLLNIGINFSKPKLFLIRIAVTIIASVISYRFVEPLLKRLLIKIHERVKRDER